MSKSHLQLHLAALHVHLEHDPYKYSEAFDGENKRVMDTTDYFTDEGGRALSAFVVLDPTRHIAEIKWIEAGALPSGEDDEPDEDEHEF